MPLNDKSIMLGRYPVFAHTMLRVKDPVKSGLFYEKLLGMKLLTRFDFPNLAFSLFFYASPEIEIPKDLRSQTERAKWLWNLRFPTLELTHNWGTERNPDFHYHNGNEDPKGFVHLAFVVDDVTVAIEELKSQGVPVLQYPHHSEVCKPLAWFLFNGMLYRLEKLHIFWIRMGTGSK